MNSLFLFKINLLLRRIKPLVYSVADINGHRIIRIFGIKISVRIPEPIKQDTKVKILIAYHRPSEIFKNEICIPIHCGRALQKEPSYDGKMTGAEMRWMRQNMIGDDTGNNISYLNRKLNELTAFYWAWKNYNVLGNPEYIGLMHYRTLFTLYPYPSYDTYLNAHGIKEDHILKLFKTNKFISSSFQKRNKTARETHASYSWCGVDPVFYDEFIKLLKEKYPQDLDDFMEYSNNKQTGPFKNMVILPRDEFFKFCEWFFPKIIELDKRMSNYDYSKDKRSIRNLSWIAEYITSYYFLRLGEKNPHYEATVFRPCETEWKKPKGHFF